MAMVAGSTAILSGTWLAHRQTTTINNPRLATVVISGKTFRLELADDDAALDRGLGGRTGIPADGGMLFVFPEEDVRFFVMRDCPVPLDLLFLDAAGRVLATHAMQPEPARAPGESAEAYDARLKVYSSNEPALFAVEIRGGTILDVAVNPGDLVRIVLPDR